MAPPAFAHRILTRDEDIDDLGHVNNVNYLRWMLEAAGQHWLLYRADDAARVGDGIGWVVIRHELDYFLPAFVGDTIDVITWVPTVTALTCDRYYEVIRVRDGALLARGVSAYCVVDRASGKPRRLSEPLRQLIGGPEVVARVRQERSFPPRPSEVRRVFIPE
ncbi:MAG: acyl-CoA thioesterase [Gemmatimonadales bacterium]